METPNLSPFLSKRRSIEGQHAAQQTANTFSRGLSQKRGARQSADFTQGFQRATPGFAASFGHRGLADSGIYKRALQDFAGDYTRDFGRLQEDLFDQDQGYQMQSAGYTAARDTALADLELEKANTIALTAAGINGLKPLMGGY